MAQNLIPYSTSSPMRCICTVAQPCRPSSGHTSGKGHAANPWCPIDSPPPHGGSPLIAGRTLRSASKRAYYLLRRHPLPGGRRPFSTHPLALCCAKGPRPEVSGRPVLGPPGLADHSPYGVVDGPNPLARRAQQKSRPSRRVGIFAVFFIGQAGFLALYMNKLQQIARKLHFVS